MVRSIVDDLHRAARGLRRDPLLVLIATITLATCIAATTTIFSVVNSVLIRPLVYPASERIDWISERSGPAHEDLGVAPDYYAIREQNRIFEETGAVNSISANWTGVERPERLDAASASASFFRVMGTRPLMGRYFDPGEEGPKRPAVVIVSYAFWRNRLGMDPDIVGKSIGIDRLQHTVIGVMPQGFDIPHGAQVWVPVPWDKVFQGFPLSSKSALSLTSIVARRKAGVSALQAETEMNRLTFAIRNEYKVFHATGFRSDLTISAIPLQRHLTGDVRPALLVLTGAVGLVLLIACVNLANLLLARAGSRQRELAVRLALGSSRVRLIRQMLAESLVLAAPGGIAGIGIAWTAVRLLNAAKPSILMRYPAITIDWQVVAFTIAVTIGTSLVFGTAPAVFAAGIQIQEALKGAASAHTATRLRKALVVAELGVSLTLLVAAGLLVRSFVNLAHVGLGFTKEHLLTFRVNPTLGPFGREYGQFYTEILGRLQQIPAVTSAAVVADMPLSDEDYYWTARVHVVGRPAPPFPERPVVNTTAISANFFHTLEIPLRSGRVFDSQDSAPAAPRVDCCYIAAERVVVNEAFARRIFPGENPLGQRVGIGPDGLNVTWTVIGVVGNARGSTLGADPPSMVYRCICSGTPVFRAGFAIRAAGDPKALVRAVEQQVRSVDRDQPIFDVKSMEERRDSELAPERFQLILIGAFTGIAILLAAAGVYGVMSYLVTRRTREIGIRMALGAGPVDVLNMVMSETARLVLLAIAIGLASAYALMRYIRFMLYGISQFDLATLILTSAFLVAIVLFATLGPARRAVNIDPMKALREN